MGSDTPKKENRLKAQEVIRATARWRHVIWNAHEFQSSQSQTEIELVIPIRYSFPLQTTASADIRIIFYVQHSTINPAAGCHKSD